MLVLYEAVGNATTFPPLTVAQSRLPAPVKSPMVAQPPRIPVASVLLVSETTAVDEVGAKLTACAGQAADRVHAEGCG